MKWDKKEKLINLIKFVGITERKFIAPLVFLIICGFFAILSPTFINIANIANVARQASINILVAIGMTIVILTSGIDLSVGSIVAISACTMGQLFIYLHFNLWISIFIGIVVGTLFGLLNGVVIHYGKVPPFIATLGMMGIARGSALIITRGYPTIGFPKSFQFIGAGSLLYIPVPFLIALIILMLFIYVLRFTVTGRSFFAVGGNEEAAKFSGIRIGYTKICAYSISGFCSSLAGIIIASRINSTTPIIGIGYELNAIAAVIIGGTNLFGGEGSVTGTILGALIMAVINNGLVLLDVSPFLQRIIIGWIVIFAVMASTMGMKKL